MKNQVAMEYILEIKTPKINRFFILRGEYYTLGRSSKNSIVIKDRQVSRYHARIIRQEQQNQNYDNSFSFSLTNHKVKLDKYCFSIYDGDRQGKGSSNGLIINGKSCLSSLLKVGDIIQLGDRVKLKYYQLSAQSAQLMAGYKKLERVGS